MKNLKHIYNPNLCITSWERCSMFEMDIIDSKLVIDKSMRYMRKTNQGIHVWVTSWVFWCKHGQSWCSSIHNGWSQCVSTIVYSLNVICLWHKNNPSNFHAFLLWAHRPMERAHVTSRFVHFICKVNMVGLTILTKWKNVMKKEQYNECIKKVGKTWYHLTIHAMIEILFKVKKFPSIQYSMNLSLCCEISYNFYIV
jgi:hypothetical protein